MQGDLGKKNTVSKALFEIINTCKLSDRRYEYIRYIAGYL